MRPARRVRLRDSPTEVWEVVRGEIDVESLAMELARPDMSVEELISLLRREIMQHFAGNRGISSAVSSGLIDDQLAAIAEDVLAVVGAAEEEEVPEILEIPVEEIEPEALPPEAGPLYEKAIGYKQELESIEEKLGQLSPRAKVTRRRLVARKARYTQLYREAVKGIKEAVSKARAAPSRPPAAPRPKAGAPPEVIEKLREAIKTYREKISEIDAKLKTLSPGARKTRRRLLGQRAAYMRWLKEKEKELQEKLGGGKS